VQAAIRDAEAELGFSRFSRPIRVLEKAGGAVTGLSAEAPVLRNRQMCSAMRQAFGRT
jgi:hypothetical protein